MSRTVCSYDKISSGDTALNPEASRAAIAGNLAWNSSVSLRRCMICASFIDSTKNPITVSVSPCSPYRDSRFLM